MTDGRLTAWLLLSIVSLLINQCYSQWRTYTRFNGYIPSYTYPIQLNAGDQLSGYLTWPGTQDLDIYLYSNGSDLLSRTVWLDRQFSPTLNPEDLIYTISTTGLYYLRVDLYSTVPTAYEFRIRVNGVLLQTFYDTVITVTSGRTAQQFSVSGPCQVRIKYDGPIYDLYLFAPGASVIIGTPVGSDSSNTNPKFITQALTSAGLWNIVIHHRLTSAIILTPFSMIVQTAQGSNQCTNMCSSIPYTDGIIPGTSLCYCQPNFIWIQANSSCSIECSAYNSTNIVGSRIAGTANQCQCLKTNYVWSTTFFMCVLDCTLLPLANGQNDNYSCFCLGGYQWDASYGNCVRNCSQILYTVRLDAANTSACECVGGFYWDAGTSSCFVNCSNVLSASGSVSTSQCSCIPTFIWLYSPTPGCYIDCNQYPSTTGIQPGIQNICICSHSLFFWNTTSFTCNINCSLIQYSSSSNFNDRTSCICNDKFVWDAAQYRCQINCNVIQWATGVGNGLDQCACIYGYRWNAVLRDCIIDCATVMYAIANSNLLNTDVCQCQMYFYWVLSPPNSYCQINCSLITQAADPLTPAINRCMCPSRHQWSTNTLTCQLDCSQIEYTESLINTSTSLNINGSCLCIDKFQWQSLSEHCLIDCNSLNFTNGNVNESIDQCRCLIGFQWKLNVLECEVSENAKMLDGVVLEWRNGDICGLQWMVNVQLPSPYPTQLYNTINVVYHNSGNPSVFYPQQNIKLTSISTSSNSIQISLKIVSNIQSSSIGLHMSLQPITLSQNPSLPPSLLLPLLFPDSITPALYSTSQCNFAKKVSTFAKVTPFVLFSALTFAVLFGHKIVILEMFGVLQFAYFCLGMLWKDVDLYFQQFVGLKSSNGFNFEWLKEERGSLPRILKYDMGYHIYFVNNMNAMLMVLLSYILLMLTIYYLSSTYNKRKKEQKTLTVQTINQTTQDLQFSTRPPTTLFQQSRCCPPSALQIQNLSLKALKEGAISLLFFNVTNFSFATVVFYKYFWEDNQGDRFQNYKSDVGFWISNAAILIVFCLTFWVLWDIVIGKHQKEFNSYGEFVKKFKKHWICQYYIVISFTYRILLSILMSFSLEDIISIIYPIIICSTFNIYIILFRPFLHSLHTLRSVILHLTELLTLCVCQYYRSTLHQVPLPIKSHMHEPFIAVYISILVCLGFTALGIIEQMYLFVRQYILTKRSGKVGNQIYQGEKENKSGFQEKQRKKKLDMNIIVTEAHIYDEDQ